MRRKQIRRHEKNRRKGWQAVLMVLLVFSVVLSMSGCRESMTIAKILHDQQAEQQDKKSNSKVTNNDEHNKNEDRNLPERKQSDDASSAKNKKVAGAKGTKKRAGEASSAVTNRSSSNHTKADRTGSGSDEKNNENSKNKNGTGGDEGRAKRTSGNAGTARDAKGRQVYDDNGKVVDLPKNVDSVAAPGEAAILVQMLGGKGILQGTSKSVAQNDIAQAVFSDENIGKARTYWNGDGSTPMSSSNFARLLAAKPDVCIVSSGMSSFTNAQIKKLKTKKIAYAVLPAMNSAEHIEKATELVGKMLGNRSNRSGGVNAKKLASEFNDYAEDQIASVKGKTNGGSNVYALYLSGWDGKAKFTIPNLSWNETGLAYITLGNSPVREMMKAAGITENASSYPLADGKDYAAIPLNITAESNVSVTNGLELTGRKGKDSLTFNSSRALGQNRFKYVVTNSRATRSHVLSSKDSGNGLWSVYGRVSIASGGSTVSDYGFTKNGRIIRTTIRGNYNVAANPCGAGNWAEGSAESVLEPVWAAWQIGGKYARSDVESEIRNFYQKFYRHRVTDCQLSEILAGK